MGLRRLERIGMEAIQTRVGCLTDWLIARLLELRHGNGRALVRIYGPASGAMRGGTVTMNFYDPDGHLLDYRRIDELAGLAGDLAQHRLLLQSRRRRMGRGPDRRRHARGRR